MGFRARKHRQVQPVLLAFQGGVNLYDAPQHIPEGQCSVLTNMLYANREAVPVTRTGLQCLADAVAPGVGISKLHHYQKNSTEAHVVAAMTDGKLYRLAGPAWVEIALLNASGVTPSMVTFNGRLIVADGSPHLHYWDGVDYAEIPGSPQATAVIESRNRLVCNSAEDLDGVYFSGPEDELMWDTGQAGSASFYRAGYRDALSVVGFGQFGSDLMVFKQGPDGGRIYRVLMTGAEPWEIVPLSKSVTATSAGAIEFVQNNVLFGSDTGVLDVGGVIQYGELEVGTVGKMINPLLQGKKIREISYIPSLGVALCMVDGDFRILAFHPHNGAWSVLDYQQMFMTTACQAGSDVLIAGSNGRLYRISRQEDRDEIAPGQFSDYTGVLRTRTLLFEAGEIVRKTRLHLESITEAIGTVAYLGLNSPDPKILADINTQVGLGQLYDANGPLADATQKLGAFTVDYVTSYDRARDAALAYEIKTSSGRIKVRQLYAELATVNG